MREGPARSGMFYSSLTQMIFKELSTRLQADSPKFQQWWTELSTQTGSNQKARVMICLAHEKIEADGEGLTGNI